MIGPGFLLFDGASHKHALAWLCQTFPEHSPRPLLQGTAYAALAEIGPILLEADAGSALHEAWAQGRNELLNAVWLKSDLPLSGLRDALQSRLRILSPDRREFWLRLADSRPLLNVWRTHAHWPDGFWYGVHEVWLRHHEGPLMAWSNEKPESNSSTSQDTLYAQITLDWPLLEALAQDESHLQDAQA